MDKTQNHWIALYLSGQYPGFYTLPDRLNFFDELKNRDYNYTDVVLGQFQNKSDIEFFYGLLNLFQKKHSNEEYNQLLIDLGIPEKVKYNPKEEKKQESKIEKRDDNFSELIYKEIANTLDNEIKKYFFNGLKTKDYGVYLREILNYLSIYLKDYHNKIGLPGEKKEGDAVEAIFQNPNLKITGVNLTTEDGKSKKEGLYKLLLGTFKNYRNILAHNKSDDLKINLGEYLETFLFINQLIKDVKEKFPLN